MRRLESTWPGVRLAAEQIGEELEPDEAVDEDGEEVAGEVLAAELAVVGAVGEDGGGLEAKGGHHQSGQGS